MKILIACSSSGGHINPAINFGNYLKSKNHEVTYLGFKNQIESKIILKDSLISIDGENSFKKNVHKMNFIKIFKQICLINKKENYDLYIGFGGFINFLLIFLKKKPLFIHEQNVKLGDTNKIVRLFSKKVFYSFENNDKKGIIVGNPSAAYIKPKEFNYKKNLNIIFVFGSLGSKSLINKLIQFDGKLNNNHKYTLVTGLSDKNQVNYNFKQINKIDYFNLKDCINDYDLIICRGGATTLYEVLKARINCISIPSPYVKNNHQEANVDYLVEKNLISKIKEKDLSLETLEREINNFIDYDYALSRYQDLSELKLKDSNELIYDELIKHVKD